MGKLCHEYIASMDARTNGVCPSTGFSLISLLKRWPSELEYPQGLLQEKNVLSMLSRKVDTLN